MSASNCLKDNIEMNGQLLVWNDQEIGVSLAFKADSIDGYESIFLLEDGDKLEVIDYEGNIMFDDTINLEYNRGSTLFFEVPGQRILGCLVTSGLQIGVMPEQWVDMFISKYPAKITRNQL